MKKYFYMKKYYFVYLVLNVFTNFSKSRTTTVFARVGSREIAYGILFL